MQNHMRSKMAVRKVFPMNGSKVRDAKRGGGGTQSQAPAVKGAHHHILD